MADSGREDSMTHLNTQLNKSMILMENAVDIPPEKPRRSKSIKISTTARSPSATNSPAVKSRKSILKKTDRSFNKKSTDGEIIQANGNIENLTDVISQRLLSSTSNLARPHNLRELIERETLNVVSCESFDLNDISDSEEIWIMDIPYSIDPKELHGQKITLGDNSKIKIKDKQYRTIAHNITDNVTCVLSTGKEEPQYKTVNMKSVGLLKIRRKLPGASKIKPIPSGNTIPSLPDKLKLRHPLLGVRYDDNIRKNKKNISRLKRR